MRMCTGSFKSQLTENILSQKKNFMPTQIYSVNC